MARELIPSELRVELPPDASAPRRARTRVVEALGRDAGVDLDVVALLVSELVTNVVLHARSAARVRLLVDRGCIRVEVSDDHPPLPVIRAVAGPEVSGRGLRIVEELSDRWGIEVQAAGTNGSLGGKTVWFELDRDTSAGAGRRPGPQWSTPG